MPSVPTSGFQLAVLIVLVVPGIVYQFVRTRLRGPAADDQSAVNRVLRALGVSGGLALAYLWILGPSFYGALRAGVVSSAGLEEDPGVRVLAGWALFLLFVVPSLLAVLVFYAPRLVRRAGITWRLTYDPIPRAWDFGFWDRGPCFVRILTSEGRYVGGWFGTDSFASSFPEPREIFVEAAYRMAEDGTFGPRIDGTCGLFVRCDDVVLVEFVDAPAATTDDGGESEELGHGQRQG